MYSRGYYSDTDEKINLPDSYDGVAFSELKATDTNTPTSNAEGAHEEPEAGGIGGKNPWEDTGQKKEAEVMARPGGGGIFSGLGSSPFFKGLFGGGSLLGIDGLKMPKIGTEELLIIATALFLLFSHEGDKECGIILLLLLFVN